MVSAFWRSTEVVFNSHRRAPQQVWMIWVFRMGGSLYQALSAKSIQHIDTNIDLDGWEIGEDEMSRMSGIKKRERVYDDVKRLRLPIRVFLNEESDGWGPALGR